MSTQYKDDVSVDAQKATTKPPPLYKVLLLNDDFTPMDFVVDVLQHFFHMNAEKATTVMLQCTIRARDFVAFTPKTLPPPR